MACAQAAAEAVGVSGMGDLGAKHAERARPEDPVLAWEEGLGWLGCFWWRAVRGLLGKSCDHAPGGPSAPGTVLSTVLY